ncbi:MAG: hypothetical protein EBQ67_01175 [Sphingobacteriia bacterium]|nr:hypothetical protein [Sphingobacteriia bacterium]
MKLASVSRWTLLIAVILVGSALMTPWATASDKAIASTRPRPAYRPGQNRPAFATISPVP